MSGWCGSATPFVFNFPAWQAIFPELSGVSEPAALQYFAEATIFVGNDGRARIRDVIQRGAILNLVTAHIAQLRDASAPGASPLVGRISSATEGSVSVQADYPTVPGSVTAAWYDQTKYGAQAYAMMGPYRSGPVYVPPVQYGGYRGGGPWGSDSGYGR